MIHPHQMLGAVYLQFKKQTFSFGIIDKWISVPEKDVSSIFVAQR